MRAIFLVVCAAVTAGVSGLWVNSWGGGWERDWVVGGYSVHVASRAGGMGVTWFRTVAEDGVYGRWEFRYWMAAAPAVGMLGLAGWWWWRGRRREGGRGFPVERNG